MVFALCITALFLIVAMVIDLGVTRSERRNGQLAVDNAATAAGQTYAESNAVTACETAVDHMELTLDTSFTGHNCSALTTCPGSGPVSASAPGFDLAIHNPVEDTSPLLDSSSTIGADPSPFAGDTPGEPCNRFGVELTTTGDAFFGGVAGQNSRTSTVHAVVVVTPPDDPGRLINLAVLHRTDCEAITTSGNGGVVAEEIVDPVEGILPGNISVDSDASGGGCGSTVELGGANALVRADGPAGCDDELTPGTGDGCGDIFLFAEGAPGCNAPACDEGTGTVAPDPDRVLERLTRAPIDHRWNCKSDYSSEFWFPEQSIPGCGAAAMLPPYIDQLKAGVGTTGTPAGYQSYTGEGFPCSVQPSDLITVPEGNWHVDCPTLRVKGPLNFLGGNVIFDGDVNLQSGGVLTVNTLNTGSSAWSEGDPLDITQSSATEAFVYFRDGKLDKVAQASITLQHTMGYFSPTSHLEFAGGSGAVTWTAPTSGPFTDLALWSDGNTEFHFGGSSGMVLEGAYFVPLATVEYKGNGGNDVVAQFISEKLIAGGNGFLRLKPVRGITVPPRPTVVNLIR